MLVEAIDPGKNLGLEGINGCRSILRYLVDLGNRAAASRLTELDQMCAHLAPVQPVAELASQAMSATPNAIGSLTQPFSFTNGHRPSGARHPTSPSEQTQSAVASSTRQLEAQDNVETNRRSADFIGVDLANLPLDDIDSLYWTCHPPRLSFTGVEQVDWGALEQEISKGM